MTPEFKVGDRVYNINRKLSGKITSIENEGEQSVLVLYDNGAYGSYLPDGRLTKYDQTATIIPVTAFERYDIVSAWGIKGEVVEIVNTTKFPIHHPVKVKLDNGLTCSFTIDGKQNEWHKEPTLQLLGRLVKKEPVKGVAVNKKPSYWGLELNGDLLEVFGTPAIS